MAERPIPIPDEMYKRARLIGGGNGIKQYNELNAYVRGKTADPIVRWERNQAGMLFAIVDPDFVKPTRGAEIGRSRPA